MSILDNYVNLKLNIGLNEDEISWVYVKSLVFKSDIIFGEG